MAWRHILNGAGLLLLAFLVVLIWTGREGAWLVLLGAFMAFAVANLETIKRFKASMSGVEAETREVIRDAKDALRELRNLAKQFASVFIVMLQAEGRWGGGLNDERKTEVEDRILSNLADLGLQKKDIEEVRSMERPFVLFDYATCICRNIKRDKFTPEQHENWRQFFAVKKREGMGHEASPDELATFLESLDLMTDERRELIEDYRYYEANTRHRRPDVWKRRKDWN